MSAPQIVWLRRDLRLRDQAAFRAAARAGPVIPIYVLDDETPEADRRMGGASRWWLHHSLANLDADLRKLGSRLILRQGRSAKVLGELLRETGAGAVHSLRHYEPWWREAEAALAKTVRLELYEGNYLTPPGSVLSGSGTPYRIYTPFWRTLRDRMPPPEPLDSPRNLAGPELWPESDLLDSWGLLPRKADWAGGLADEWTPGEAGAGERLADFAPHARHYDAQRNLPSREGSSRLSAHLHFGEISPAQVWHAVARAGGSVDVYLSEIAWRDFAQNLIFETPDYDRKNGKPRFDALPWRSGKGARADLRAWQQGRTGYPIVDAGMRQLWTSGWMHNRVRMIAASFLIKHLLIDWREGEAWFWDTLVDADFGNNTVNWQWVAGTGVDASIFSRIMAPLVQSEKFDAAGYIRQWVPELAGLSDGDIHDPVLRPSGYPARIIEHRAARERVLEAFAKVRA